MDLIPQTVAAAAAAAAVTPREARNNCGAALPEVTLNLPVSASLTATEEAAEASNTAEAGNSDRPAMVSPPPATAPNISVAVDLAEESCRDSRKQTFLLNCGHLNFPCCECVAQAHEHRPPHGRLGRRAGRRNRHGPSLPFLRDRSLEVFDENEESDFQESETETDTTLADTTDAESDCTAGLESDVEGAVGGAAPELLAPPSTSEERRASIVIVDSRHDEILPSPEPIKVAVFGTDGVGKSGECYFKPMPPAPPPPHNNPPPCHTNHNLTPPVPTSTH